MGKLREFYEVHDRKSLDCLEKRNGTSIQLKGSFGEVSKENDKHVIGN